MAGFLLAGCMSTPPSQIEELQVEVPAAWDTAASGEAFYPQGWMKDFGDPQMVEILREALQHNFALMAAEARLDASTAGTFSARSEMWPGITLSANRNDSRRSSAQGIQQTPVNTSYSLTGRFNWEIDLWGQVRNGYKGDLADAEAAIADFEATRLSIAGRTAQAWYNAIEAEQQLALAKRTLDAFNESQRIVEEGFAQGIGSALDVRLIRANLASAASSYELRLRNLDSAVRNLEVLLGRYPKGDLEVAKDWPEIGYTVPPGLPSDLLLRRPDVLAAERELAAAQQRKFEAKKAMLPNLSITLTRGTNEREVDNLLDLDQGRVWSRIWSVSQPLFQGGRLKANKNRAEANHRLAIANFTTTALTAFREVEIALREQSSYSRDFELQQIAAEESQAAEELAWEQYESGLVGITTVLDSVRRSLNAQRSLITTTNRRIQSRIDLYLALGGGFSFDPPAEN
ncbi:MAG: efflux transporter outer membrane subunit [Synoicihabitans sp.]